MIAEEEVALGFMKSEPVPDGSVWFSALRVHPLHRRKGVGEALTSFAIELARKNNSTYVRLIIEPTNSASMNLASKFGFHRMEEYRFFSGTFDSAGLERVDFSGDVYINLGWSFAKLSDCRGRVCANSLEMQHS